MGRKLKSINGIYHDRIIDIDLIKAYRTTGEEIIVETTTLVMPHIKMQERAFVIEPLKEVLHIK